MKLYEQRFWGSYIIASIYTSSDAALPALIWSLVSLLWLALWHFSPKQNND